MRERERERERVREREKERKKERGREGERERFISFNKFLFRFFFHIQSQRMIFFIMKGHFI